MTIILADAEKDYLVCLADRLMSCIQGLRLDLCAHLNEIERTLKNCDERTLLIYNPADFADFKLSETCIRQKIERWMLIAGNTPAESGCHAFRRIGSSAPLVSEIRNWLAESGAAHQSDRFTMNTDSQKKNECQLHFVCSVEPSGYRPDHSRKVLLEMVMSHEKVIYLPLMPTYQMSCICSPGNGPSMSDLLLHLVSHDVLPEDLGQFLQPNPDGYLQFRPPDRSDDLVTCTSGTIRDLIVLIRNHVKKSVIDTVVMIDCAGLPFSSYSAVAVLCDTCQIILPERESFATQSARQETGRLLAELPSGCLIIGQNESYANLKTNNLSGEVYDN